MGDLLELVERLPAHPLRGRVWGEELGIGLFELPQVTQKVVVVRIGDLRVVEDVVAVIVVGDLPPELLCSLLCPLRGAHRLVGAFVVLDSGTLPAAAAESVARASMPAKSHWRRRSRLGRSVRSKWTGVTEIRSCAIAERSDPASSSNEGS